MPKVIEHHKLNDVNNEIELIALDEPGPGGAHHKYQIKVSESLIMSLTFQHGPLGESGPNGLTNEVLAAAIIDRLEGFQSGEFANEFNENALNHFRAGLNWLLQRTRDRIRRGVEGQNKA